MLWGSIVGVIRGSFGRPGPEKFRRNAEPHRAVIRGLSRPFAPLGQRPRALGVYAKPLGKLAVRKPERVHAPPVRSGARTPVRAGVRPGERSPARIGAYAAGEPRIIWGGSGKKNVKSKWPDRAAIKSMRRFSHLADPAHAEQEITFMRLLRFASALWPSRV